MKFRTCLKEYYDPEEIYDLEYDNLNLDVTVEGGARRYNDGSYTDTYNGHIEYYDYQVPVSRIIEALEDILWDEGIFPEGVDDEDITRFIRDNADQLAEDYHDELLDVFRADAERQAEEDYVIPEPDYDDEGD